jgi:hypothetical protein
MMIKLDTKIVSVSLIVMSVIITMSFFLTSFAQNNNNIIQNQITNNTDPQIDKNNFPFSLTIPVEKGYVNGNVSYFISTDASEQMIVSSVTNTTKFNVNYAPTLADTPEVSRQQGYVFTNGVEGNGTFDHQLPIATASANDDGYSPLFEINYVTWNNGSQPKVLKSAQEVLDAQSKGELTVVKSNVVINSPAVDLN